MSRVCLDIASRRREGYGHLPAQPTSQPRFVAARYELTWFHPANPLRRSFEVGDEKVVDFAHVVFEEFDPFEGEDALALVHRLQGL